MQKNLNSFFSRNNPVYAYTNKSQLTVVCAKKWYFLRSFLNNNLLFEPGAHVFNMDIKFS